jgi:hypothetical protein
MVKQEKEEESSYRLLNDEESGDFGVELTDRHWILVWLARSYLTILFTISICLNGILVISYLRSSLLPRQAQPTEFGRLNTPIFGVCKLTISKPD